MTVQMKLVEVGRDYTPEDSDALYGVYSHDAVRGLEYYGEVLLNDERQVGFQPIRCRLLNFDELAQISKLVSHLQVSRSWDPDGGAER